MSTSPLPLSYTLVDTTITGDINVEDVYSSEVNSATVLPIYDPCSWEPVSYTVNLVIGVSDSKARTHGTITAAVNVPSLNDAVFLVQESLHMDPNNKVSHRYVQWIIDFATTQKVG